MADINDLMREVLGPDVPVPATNQAANEDLGYRQGAAMDVGLRNGSVDADWLLNPGTQAENEAILRGRANYMEDASRTRVGWRKGRDATVDVINGAMQGVLGIGAAGGGIVDALTGNETNIGGTLSGWSDKSNQWMQSIQSDALNDHRQAQAVRSEITSEHNAALEQEEIARGDSPLIAGMRRIGRDISRAWTNSTNTTIGSGISSGVGSMLVGGLFGKGLKAMGLKEALAMPTAIGALEGGGAYQQTVSEVMSIDHDKLMSVSEDYRELIRKGASPEEAKTALANRAGLKAAAIQAPIGVATGALVSKFEASPFKVPTVRGAFGNIAKEGIEEGIQSGSGALATNYAVNDVDPTKDMLDGVGQQIGEGAIYGLGTAGVVQAPGLPLAAGRAAVDAAITGTKAGVSKLVGRGQAIEAEAEAASPVSTTNLRERFNNVVNQAASPEFLDMLKERLGGKAEPTVVESYVNNIKERMTLDREAEAAGVSSPLIQQMIMDSNDRFDAIQRAGQIVTNEASSDQDKLDAGAYIVDQLQKNQSLFGSDLDDGLQAAEQEGDEASRQWLGELSGVLTGLSQNPEIVAATTKAMEMARNLTPESLTTPASIEAAATLAEANPDAVSPEVVETILKHASDKGVNIPPMRVRSLEAMGLIRTEEAAYEATKENITKQSPKSQTTPSVVSGNLTEEGRKGYLSAKDHLDGINQAVRAGNNKLARERLFAFRKLAQHMQGKVNALNENLAKGTGREKDSTSYPSLNAKTGKFAESRKGMWVNPEIPQTVAFAQQVANDAETITRLFNNLATIFSDLGVEQLEDTRLDEALQGAVRDVAERHRRENWAANRRAGRVQEKSEPARESAPDETVSTEVEAQPEQPAANRVEEPKKESKIARKVPTTKAEYTKYIKDIVRKAGKGRLETRPAYPDSMAEGTEKGMYRFGYRTEDNVLVEGNYRIDGNDLIAFDIGDTSNPVQMGGEEVKSLIRQLAKAHPNVDYFEAYRISGARNQKQMIWAIKDGDKLRIRLTDPRQAKPDESEVSEAPETETEVERSADTTAKEPVEKPEEETNEPEPDPEAEQQPEEPATEEPDATVAGSNIVSKLFRIPGKLVNLFVTSFRFNPEKSRLVNDDRPMRSVYDLLAAPAEWAKAVGDNRRGIMTPEISKAYQRLLRKEGVDLANALRKRLQEQLNRKRADSSLLKALNADGTINGNEVTNFNDGRVTNLLEKQEDGSFDYNTQVLEAATLAALQWLLTSGNRNGFRDREKVAELLGVDENSIPNGAMEFFNQGVPVMNIKRDLGAMIGEFIGVEMESDANIGTAQGILEAMAAEMLHGMVDTGLVEQFSRDFNGKDYIQIVPKMEQGNLVGVRGLPTAIEQVVLGKADEMFFFGSPPETVAKGQLRNRGTGLTSQQRQMIENEQGVPYRVARPMLDLYSALGDKLLLKLFGEEINPEWNENYATRVKSQNLTVRGALETLRGMLDQMTNQGLSIDETDIFYGHEISRVGRLQMQGANNPQANKIMREVILPGIQEVDLTDDKMITLFKVAMGQHWGVKTDQMRHADIVTKVDEMARTQLAPAIKLLRGWLKTGNALTENDVQVLRDAFGGEISPAAVHALVEYARVQNATVEERKAFKTSTYLEADGKTDGPGNVVMHLSDGPITAAWIRMAEKIGYFIGSRSVDDQNRPMSLNEFVARDQDDAKTDVYGMAAKAATRKWHEMYRNATPAVRAQHEHLIRVLQAFDVGIDFEDNIFRLTRSALKNPLTITGYGSGLRGIAGNFADEVIAKAYEGMSKGTVPDEIWFSLKALMEGIAVEKKVVPSKAKGSSKTGTKFEFTPSQKKALTSNILNLLVGGPMQAGINQTMGETNFATVALRKSVQVQSIYAQHVFNRLVHDRLSKQGNANNGLTRNDLKEIMGQMKHLGLMIHTGNQNFATFKSKRADLRNQAKIEEIWAHNQAEKLKAAVNPEYTAKELPYPDEVQFGHSLSGNYRTPGFVDAPANIGVGGIPMVIIGTGDAQMIMNYSNDPDRPNALLVFDGINLGLNDIETGSRVVNKAVLDGWLQTNPMADASVSFDTFMSDVDLSQMGPAMQLELTKALLGPAEETAAPKAELIDMMRELQEDLKSIGQSIEARKAVMRKLTTSVDHMASGASPYAVQGIDLTGSPEEMATEMNKLYEEELARIRADEAGDKVRPVSEVIDKVLETVGTVSETTGVRQFDLNALRRVLTKMSIPREQMVIMAEAIKQLSDQTVEVIAGTVDQINAYRQEAGLSALALTADDNGFMVPSEGRVYLINPTSEVLAHELVHASTYDKLVNYYRDGGSNLTPLQMDAIQRLEAMLEEWRDLGEKNRLPSQVWAAHAAMMQAVEGHEANGNKAAALNEFMAWSLTNKDLIEGTRETPVKSKLVQLGEQMIDIIKALFWGRKTAPVVGKDFYSNLRFNTQILMMTPVSLQDQITSSVLFHSNGKSADERLKTTRRNFARKVALMVNKSAATKPLAKTRFSSAMVGATDVANTFEAHGFRMSQEEKLTFQIMVAALATEIEADPTALARMQEVYADAMERLTEESFMADPAANNFADRHQASEKLNTLLGSFGTTADQKGRSSLLPAFIALATTNEEFREILSKLEAPKTAKSKGNTLNDKLDNFGNGSMDRLMKWASGEKNAKSSIEAIDALTERVAQVMADQQNLIQQGWTASGNFVDRANQMLVDGANWLNDKVSEKATEIRDNSNNKFVKGLANVAEAMTGIINEQKGAILAEGVNTFLNKNDAVPRFIKELFVEIHGRTESNAPVYDMIKRVRSYVQQTRQQFREHQPKIIAKAFSRTLEKAEWQALTKGLAKTDIASLVQAMGSTKVTQLLGNPSLANKEIKRLIDEIRSMDANHADRRIQKAKELAEYMMTGKASGNLLRNAHAIAELYGEMPNNVRLKTVRVPDGLEDAIDQLVSLYAYTALDSDTKQAVSKLVADEADGIGYTISFLQGQRKAELDKAKWDNRGRINHYKGRIPLENDGGSSLIVAEDREAARLALLGYTRVGDYKGSKAERGASSKGYFFAPVHSRSAFKQGIMQNIRRSVYGVDPKTGYTVDTTVSGVIDHPNAVSAIERNIRANNGSQEPLLPIYNGSGEVVAYERSVAPEQHARLDINEDLSEVLGIWRGRQAEEHFATRFNYELVQNLADQWNKEKDSRKDEYIDLFSKEAQKDPVYRDAARLITPEARSMIRDAFGDKTFMVRKELVNDVIGYRSVSVGDSWTGVSRINPEVQKTIRQVALGILGKDAFKKLVQYERVYQTVVTDAKVTIVVKSVVVPAFNIASNIIHLASRGVPLTNIARGFTKKAAETDSYLKNRLRKMQLDADLRAAEGRNDAAAQQLLKSQIRSILDANRRLSIWPLIEAGELASVSDTGISHEDVLLSEGKISEYMEKLTNSLPPELQTAAKYGLVARDTSLFKGLQKAVEYGDFLAKAVLYEHLTKRQGKSHEEAMGRVTEEFVNYDRQPGRGRGYLEDMGLLWFWNFKLRSMKVALSVLRNNPLHLLMTHMLPLPDSIGTPVTDNMLSVIADGRLGYSTGLDQLFQAHALNPWVNVAS